MNRADDAVATLRKAADGGYRDLNTLKKAPDFQSLRDRADFRKLLE